jgi:hypothetical protein
MSGKARRKRASPALGQALDLAAPVEWIRLDRDQAVAFKGRLRHGALGDAIHFDELPALQPNRTKVLPAGRLAAITNDGSHDRQLRHASIAGLGVGAAPISIH